MTVPPDRAWSKRGLEKACEAGTGALDEHLANLVGLGLLVLRDSSFFHPDPMPPLAVAPHDVVRTPRPRPTPPPCRYRGVVAPAAAEERPASPTLNEAGQQSTSPLRACR